METVIAELRIKRGNKIELPSEAPVGEPLWVVDTGELYVGQGTGKSLKLINENVVSLRQAIQSLEDTKANTIHTHSTSEIEGLDTVLAGLDFYSTTEIDGKMELLEQNIKNNTGVKLKKEQCKTGEYKYKITTEKDLYDYPPIVIHKRYEKFIEEDFVTTNKYAESTGKLFIESSIENTNDTASNMIWSYPSQAINGGFPNNDNEATFIDSSDGMRIEDDGITINLNINSELVEVWKGSDYELNNMYTFTWNDYNYSYELFADTFKYIIKTKEYGQTIPDNLGIIIAFGDYRFSDYSNGTNRNFIRPNADGTISVEYLKTADNTYFNQAFISKYSFRVKDLPWADGNRYTNEYLVEKINEMISLKSPSLSSNYYTITFVSMDYASFTNEQLIKYVKNELNIIKVFNETEKSFSYKSKNHRAMEESFTKYEPYHQYTYKLGDSIEFWWHNFIDAKIAERDVAYKIDIDLPKGSTSYVRFFNTTNWDYLSYDRDSDDFIITPTEYQEYRLEEVNSWSPEMWNKLFDAFVKTAKFSKECSTAVNLEIEVFPSNKTGINEKPFKIKGIKKRRRVEEWWEEDRSSWNKVSISQTAESKEVNLKLGKYIEEKGNYMPEGSMVKDDYVLQVPYESYNIETEELYETYDVSTAEQFIEVLKGANDNSKVVKINVLNDLDFISIPNPKISNSIYYYKYYHHIEGNGYSFKNINYTSSTIFNGTDYFNLLGRGSGGSVKNLVIENSHMNYILDGYSVSEVGFLFSVLSGTEVSNITFKKCKMTYSDSGGYDEVSEAGFLAGEIDGNANLNNIHVYDSEIVSFRLEETEGISSKIGFIAGIVNNTLVRECSVVNCKMDALSYCGLLFGTVAGGEISDCYTTGEIYLYRGTTSYFTEYNYINSIGGLVGYIEDGGTIKNSYSYASLNGGSGANYYVNSVGGLVGYVDNTWGNYLSYLQNCYFGGSGFSPFIERIDYEYASSLQPEGMKSLMDYEFKSNIYGYLDGDSNIMMFDTQLSRASVEQLRNPQFTNFDFENIWHLGESGLPILKNQIGKIEGSQIRNQDFKTITYDGVEKVINGESVYEIEIDLFNDNLISGVNFSTFYTNNYNSIGLFFSTKKISDLTEDVLDAKIPIIGLTNVPFNGRTKVHIDKITDINSVAEFSFESFIGKHVNSYGSFIDLTIDEFRGIVDTVRNHSEVDATKFYAYIVIGHNENYGSRDESVKMSDIIEAYRTVGRFIISTYEEDTLFAGYEKKSPKNILLANTIDYYNDDLPYYLKYILEPLSNFSAINILQIPVGSYPEKEEWEDSIDLVIIDSANYELYDKYGKEFIEKLYSKGVPIINAGAIVSSYSDDEKYYEKGEMVDSISKVLTLEGQKELITTYNLSSKFFVQDTEHELFQGLELTGNEIDIYNPLNGNPVDTILASVIPTDAMINGEPLIVDIDGNRVLTHIRKDVEKNIMADYYDMKILKNLGYSKARGIYVTETASKLFANIINKALDEKIIPYELGNLFTN